MRRTRQRKSSSKLEEDQLIYLELYRQLRQPAAKKKVCSIITFFLFDNAIAIASFLNQFAQIIQQKEQRTLLIDADWENAKVTQFFQLQNKWGLSDALIYPHRDDSPLYQINSALSLLPIGTQIDTERLNLNANQLSTILTKYRQQFDVILIQVNAQQFYMNHYILENLDAAVLIVEKGKTERNHVQQLNQELRRNKINFVGAILNEK
ncbi:hypothetical protein FC90_GL001741 [Latilactobacillus graminis DSM 20719]|uniref:Capsular exopolysaccharide family n=2 Tax=Latilactobacillus graminis TaxID=60519 RepID=A0AA89I6H4_9LACO|nr:hypothetical protein FC90_GL001741 [Latilactobacillus graminis DSM 20719]